MVGISVKPSTNIHIIFETHFYLNLILGHSQKLLFFFLSAPQHWPMPSLKDAETLAHVFWFIPYPMASWVKP